MMRHCDGTDPNLIMFIHPATGERFGNRVDEIEEQWPCDCGETFDDAERMVIWPHYSVRGGFTP